MPIHVSFKSLAKGMAKQYKGQGKVKCRPFTDGTKVCASAKAWQVFYSYLNKKGWDDTKPMPKKLIQSPAVDAITPRVHATKKKINKPKIKNLTVKHALAHINKDYKIHKEVVEELEREGYPHLYMDELDTLEKPEEIEEIVEEPSGQYIHLEDVIHAFPSAISIEGEPWTSWLTGEIVSEGKIPKNHKIDIIFNQEPDLRLITSIKSMKPKWLADMMNIVFSKRIDNEVSVPLGKYGIFKTSKLERTDELVKDIKPFDMFKPLKHKLTFTDINEFYNVWASKYLDEGIIIQKFYDGIRFIIHKTGDKVMIISEHGNDRTKEMPNVVKETQESKIDSFVLDTTMVMYDTLGKEVKTAYIKSTSCDPVPTVSTKWVLRSKISPEQESSMVFCIHDILYMDKKSINDFGCFERFNKIHEVIPEKSVFFSHVVSSGICKSPHLVMSNIKEFREVKRSNEIIGKVADSRYPIGITNRIMEWAKLDNLQNLSINFDECLYSEREWCPVRDILLSEKELPVTCKLANIYKCHYLKDKYYRIDEDEDN